MATLNPVQIIRAIYGPEPMRSGEMPMTYMVGSKSFAENGPVTSIIERCQDLGDRSIQWFDVWCGDIRVATVNAANIAEIHYAT